MLRILTPDRAAPKGGTVPTDCRQSVRKENGRATRFGNTLSATCRQGSFFQVASSRRIATGMAARKKACCHPLWRPLGGSVPAGRRHGRQRLTVVCILTGIIRGGSQPPSQWFHCTSEKHRLMSSRRRFCDSLPTSYRQLPSISVVRSRRFAGIAAPTTFSPELHSSLISLPDYPLNRSHNHKT